MGLIKLVPLGKYKFPRKIHGFFRKISSLTVHPNEAPMVVLVSAVSMVGGGTVGPEAALGWMGCALAQVAWEVLEGAAAAVRASHGIADPPLLEDFFGIEDDLPATEAAAARPGGMAIPFPASKGAALKPIPPGFLGFLCHPLKGMDKQVVALDAIAAGLGAMFPTPGLSVLIMHELTLAAGLSIFSSAYMERISTSLFGELPGCVPLHLPFCARNRVRGRSVDSCAIAFPNGTRRHDELDRLQQARRPRHPTGAARVLELCAGCRRELEPRPLPQPPPRRRR